MTATWPADWNAMVAGRGCSMCAKGRPDDDGFGVRIQAAKYSDAYLQRADMQRGYTLVIWRGRHVAEPTELEADEAAGYWLEVLRVAEALQRHYRPLKMNYEVLGNALPHLHTHLVPRYLDDPAPGRPFPFLGVERPNLPITSRMFGVGLVGSRGIWPAHVGCAVAPDGSRRIQKDRLDDHRDDQGASDRKSDGKARNPASGDSMSRMPFLARSLASWRVAREQATSWGLRAWPHTHSIGSRHDVPRREEPLRSEVP